MRSTVMLAAILCATPVATVIGQTTREAVPAEAGVPPIQARALQAVLDARERQQDWHAAAQDAVAKVQSEPLKSQLTQRLSGLTPYVAKELMGHPQEDAFVQVSVFKQGGAEGKQAMVAVTFQGLGSDVNSVFLGSVLADQAEIPEAEDIPKDLVVDPDASSYMVFFLGKTGLQAGNIPQAKMKQSVLAAVNHQRELVAQRNQQVIAQQDQLTREQPAIPTPVPAPAHAPAYSDAVQSSDTIPQQTIPTLQYPNDGYYYPGVGVPIVILSDGFANTPEWWERQRHRERELERRRQAAVQSVNGERPNTTTPPPAGVVIPPGQAGVQIPPGQAGVRMPPGGAGVVIPSGQAGVRTQAGQGAVENPPAVRTPPANREAPAQREAPAERRAPAQEQHAPPQPPAPKAPAPAPQSPAPAPPAAQK